MKKILVCILSIFTFAGLFAERVSFEDAGVIARNWTEILNKQFGDAVTVTCGESIIRDRELVAHVFHLSPRGYLIISGQDYLPPVKMYSLSNDFGREGRALEELVFLKYKTIIQAVEQKKIIPEKIFRAENKMQFKALAGIHNRQTTLSAAVTTEVKPLLTTSWSQGEPYNLKCPLISGKRAVTGCVATAFAQVMKYHRYPQSGRGEWSYHTETHKIYLSTSFDHTYYWDRMLNNYPGASTGTPEQRQAVSRLMFDLGVALEMDYDPEGSGAHPIYGVYHFPEFFKYAKCIVHLARDGHNDQQWFNIAKSQIDDQIVVPYTIGSVDEGHHVIIDGYRIQGSVNTFHLNMGWGGSWNGYYSLNNIEIGTDLVFNRLDYQSFTLNMIPAENIEQRTKFEFGIILHENRGLLSREYVGDVTWRGIPGNNSNITGYDLIISDFSGGNFYFVDQVPHTGQNEVYHLRFRISGSRIETERERSYHVFARTAGGDYIFLMAGRLLEEEPEKTP